MQFGLPSASCEKLWARPVDKPKCFVAISAAKLAKVVHKRKQQTKLRGGNFLSGKELA